MKKSRVTFLITALISSLLIIGLILAFIIPGKGTNLFTGLNLVIFILIFASGAFVFLQAMKKNNDIKAGYPVEDELSTRIKYKAGYYAFLISMYMWLFIFLFKDKFPDTETMLGGGILLSAVISIATKFVIQRNYNEKQD